MIDWVGRSTEPGKRDVEIEIIDWVMRLEKWHSKCNRLYIFVFCMSPYHVRSWMANTQLNHTCTLCIKTWKFRASTFRNQFRAVVSRANRALLTEYTALLTEYTALWTDHTAVWRKTHTSFWIHSCTLTRLHFLALQIFLYVSFALAWDTESLSRSQSLSRSREKKEQFIFPQRLLIMYFQSLYIIYFQSLYIMYFQSLARARACICIYIRIYTPHRMP